MSSGSHFQAIGGPGKFWDQTEYSIESANSRDDRFDCLEETRCYGCLLWSTSSISGPGSQGADYRLHLSLDLGSQRIDGVEVTDVSGGEMLARHASQLGDIWLADRGYARCPDVGTILKTEGEVVVRIGWATFPMEHEDGTLFDLFEWLRKIPDAAPSEHAVVVTTPERRFSLRLIAQRLPQEAAEKNRRRIRKQAQGKNT